MPSRRLFAAVLFAFIGAFAACSLDTKKVKTDAADEPAAERGAKPAKSDEPRADVSSGTRPETPAAVIRRKERPFVAFGAAETRATWVVAYGMKSIQSINAIAEEARDVHANTLLVQVRSRGDAYYRSSIEPPPDDLSAANFDPLEEMLKAAAPDLDVHAWINCALVADADMAPRAPNHIVNAHPEWLAVPEPLALELRKYQPTNPSYVQALRDYARERKQQVEGLFVDLAIPAARAHVASVVGDIAKRYDLKGVHLDYIRYANIKYGYGRQSLDLFRTEVDRTLSKTDRADMAARVAKDPLAYVKRFKQRFADFRRAAIDQTVEAAAAAARRARPGIKVSAAVWPDIADVREQIFQDWTKWLRDGSIDIACPMIYSQHAKVFETQVRAAIAARGRGAVWPGIGAWIIGAPEVARRAAFVRSSGAPGVCLFSHQSVFESAGAPTALTNGPFKLRAKPR